MMAAYNRVNGLRCAQNPTLMQDVVRKNGNGQLLRQSFRLVGDGGRPSNA